MKNSITAGLYLLFITVIILLVLTGGFALYAASGTVNTEAGLKGGDFIKLLLGSIPLLLPLALTAGFFITFLRLNSKPGIRPLTTIILTLTAGLLLWVSGTFLGNISTDLNRNNSSEAPVPAIASGIFHKLNDGTIIYMEKSQDTEINGILLKPGENDGNAIDSFELFTGTVPVKAITSKAKENAEHNLNVPGAVPRESYKSSAFSDFTLAGGMLLDWKTGKGEIFFLLGILAFSIYSASCWGIMQISRWPLFNALAALIILSGAGSLFRILSADIFSEIVDLVQLKTMGIPPVVLVMVTAAILLLLLDILFIPFKKRTGEYN